LAELAYLPDDEAPSSPQPNPTHVMEIHLQLAGVQLGPYNEKQVREYIAEGLLSMEDKARIEGTLEWIPVSDLVTKLPPPQEPAPAPEANPVFLDAEPIGGQAPAAPEPAAPEPAPAAEAPEAEAPYVSLIDFPPGEDPFTAKTKPLPAGLIRGSGKIKPKGPLGPIAPGLPSATGSVKTKPLGPLAPTVPVNRKGVTASKSVSTTAPLGAAATKAMSRTALAKALQNKTEPLPGRAMPAPSAPPPTEVPAVPASAPETTGPMAGAVAEVVPAPPPPKKAAGLPALLKALAAKTVPIRGAVPAAEPAAAPAPEPPFAPGTPPPSRTGMPVTTPLPTRAIMNPAASRASRASSPPPAAPPVPEPVKATEKLPLPPSKKAVDMRAKAAQRAAEREAAEAPLEPEVGAAPETSPEPAAAAPRAPFRLRRLPILIAVCAVLALAGGYYVWSPYHASSELRDALAGDSSPADLAKRIDFESLRASLKQQAELLAHASGAPSTADALAIIDKSIDAYVTSEGIAGLTSKTRAGDWKASFVAVTTVTPDVAAKLVSDFVSEPLRDQGLAGPTDFVLQTDVGNLHLTLHHIHWWLTRIEIKPDLPVPAEAAGAPLGLVPVVQTYLQLGHLAADARQWPTAINYFAQATALAPQSTAACDARGTAHLAQADFDDAIKDFSQALGIDSSDTAAFNGRGNARIRKKDFDGAISDFTEAVKVDPTLASAYDNRGRAKSAKNDLDGAIQDFTQAITIDPTLASAFIDRGVARQAHGNLDGAIKDYTDALDLQPKSARTYFNRGLARLTQNNLPSAITDFDHALEIDPTIAEAWFQRGNARSARRDTDGAISDFTRTLELNPKNALAYCSRGVAREDKGDLKGAAADYSQALTLDPTIAIAYFRRALIEVRQGDPDGAIADTTQSLDLDPKNTQAYYYRGFAKLLRGNFDGATSDFRLFCDAAPHDRFADNARLYLWLIAKQQSTNHTDPDQDLSDALENGWNNPANDFTAKTAAFLLGRVTEADYLTAATSSDSSVNASQSCQAYYFAGMKRLIMGDSGTASDYFQKCVATGKRDFCEYILAQAELQKPTPPPPVPVPAAVTPPAPIPLPVTPAPVPPPAKPVGDDQLPQPTQ
jgi:tetratricopeptide (TPR) repeat protein